MEEGDNKRKRKRDRSTLKKEKERRENGRKYLKKKERMNI